MVCSHCSQRQTSNLRFLMLVCVTASLVFNQYANPVALGAIRWKYYIVYCVWLVFELAFMWRYAIETKGRSLEETAAIFDGDAVLSDLTKRTKEDVAHAGVGFDESSKSSSTEKISNPDGRTKM